MTAAQANLVGFLGAVTILAGYAYQTLRAARPDLASSALNFVGASLLAASLCVNFNLPALLLEVAWAIVALVGLVRLSRGRA